MASARLEKIYKEKIRSELKQELGLDNIMQVPVLKKIVINIGVKEAVADSRILKKVADIVTQIAGQVPVRTEAKKSIAGFKIREGMPLGVKVTLRRRNMYEFLDKFINLALPKVRDFQGLKDKLDGFGNYNVGIKEWSIFPEAVRLSEELNSGLNITIHTSAEQDEHARVLLQKFGMPFRRKRSN